MRRASWKFISVKFFLFKTIGKVCAPADSRVVAPAAAGATTRESAGTKNFTIIYIENYRRKRGNRYERIK